MVLRIQCAEIIIKKNKGQYKPLIHAPANMEVAGKSHISADLLAAASCSLVAAGMLRNVVSTV